MNVDVHDVKRLINVVGEEEEEGGMDSRIGCRLC
jgi:hypothetical protein